MVWTWSFGDSTDSDVSHFWTPNFAHDVWVVLNWASSLAAYFCVLWKMDVHQQARSLSINDSSSRKKPHPNHGTSRQIRQITLQPCFATKPPDTPQAKRGQTKSFQIVGRPGIEPETYRGSDCSRGTCYHYITNPFRGFWLLYGRELAFAFIYRLRLRRHT